MRRNPWTLVWCWLLVGALVVSPVWNATAAGPIIRRIEIVGNEAVTKATILSVIHSREGQPFDPVMVDQDIRALFARGGFADIRIEQERLSNGIKLIYYIVERPIIASIVFEGNKKIKTKEFTEKLGLHAHRPLNGEELAKAVATIHSMYEEKRYYLVDVDYELQPAQEGSALIFRIKEHGKAAVRRVQFVGNRVFPDRELKKILRTKEKGAAFFRRGKYDREMLDVDVALLMRHYLNHGYLRAHVGEPQVEISKDKRHLFATFTIEEGQQYRLSGIRVEGDILTTPEEIRSLIKTQPGTIYKHESIEEDLRALTIYYGTMGYAFANIQPMPIPNDAAGTADLVFGISKGRRVAIDRINIFGNDITRDKVIRRELLVKEGDLFNRQLLEESRTRLMQLGFFESVDIATPRGQHADSVDLNLTVKEKPTGTFNVGAGFSTAENFFFTGSVAKQNFFGRGLAGQFAVELSKRRQQYVVNVTDPHFLDSNVSLSINSARNIQRYPEYDRKSWSTGVSFGRRFFKNLYGNVGYNIEKVNAENFFLSVPETFRQNASGLTSAITAGGSYDNRDNRIYPRKGFLINVQNEISGTKLGGDNDFYRVTGAVRYYQPIWKQLKGRVFAKGGYVKSLGDRNVPLYERFILGGPNSLRGFNLWTIGPSVRIPTGPSGGDTQFVFGGNKMLQFNGELEFPIYEPAGFKLVTFVDAGNSFAEEQSWSLKNLRANYGAGLRWQSPLGPLRFEWGFPFKRRPGEPNVVFNFTIGEFY